MLKIYTQNKFLNEKEYIFNIIFSEFLGVHYEINFHNEACYKVVLPNNNTLQIKDDFFSKFKEEKGFLDEINIPSKVIYSDTHISEQKVIIGLYGNNELILKDREIKIGVDVLASSFFMLTRWEEIVIKDRDEHNRFIDKLSLAQIHNFHLRPIVDEYILVLKQYLLKLGYTNNFKKEEYEVTLTHDIDFLGRYDTFIKFIKALGGDLIVRKSIKALFKTINNFFKIKFSGQKDNYDTFDFLMNVSENYKLKSHFYFIPGKKGETDVRYDIDDKRIKSIINKILKRKHIIGLHGTYDSYNNKVAYRNEMERLTKYHKPITENRQHYLRFENPNTWQINEENGILQDSTIGYSNDVGFRSGTCKKYSIFNVLTRKMLSLKEMPLIAMETALINQKLNTNEIFNKITSIASTVKRYQGNFVLLWHNSSFNTFELKGYQKLYKTIIREIKG